METNDKKLAKAVKLILSNKNIKYSYSFVQRKLQQALQNLSKSSYSKVSIEKILDNPHCVQSIFYSDGPCMNCKFERVIPDVIPGIPYVNRLNSFMTVAHLGQYKLLLSEIEFLTEWGHLSNHVIYIAAGPGFHIPCLCKLFPDHKFYLYDPSFEKWGTKHFDEVVKKGQVFVYSQYFLEKTVDEFRRNFPEVKDLLLFSDIRRDIGDKTNMGFMNKIVLEDMELQKNIVMMINPLACILKFRLPWNDENIEYFDGTRYFGVYAPIQSTETRLVVSDIKSRRKYNGKKNEEELSYFNTVLRPAIYSNNFGKIISGKFLLDNCYDCTAKLTILDKYRKEVKYFSKMSLEDLNTFVDNEMDPKKWT